MRLPTFLIELRRSRMVGLGLGVVAVAYSGIITAMFPIMRDNARAIDDYMAMFPREIMAAFGISGSLGNPGVFFTSYISAFLWPIVAAMGGIVLATRPVAADVERGWAETTLATPLTRVASLSASIASQALVLAMLAAATVAGVLVVGLGVGAGFDAGRFAAAGVVLWLFGCAVAGIASLLGVLTLSRAVAGGAVAALLILMYLANIVAVIQPELGWLADFGAFRYLAMEDLIDRGITPWASLVVFGVAGAAGWLASVLVFRRRDLLS